MKDQQLVRACINSDRNAQKFLFDKYAEKMMAVCRRYARNQMDAEDIMQGGFVRVFEKLHTFKFKGSLEEWIRRIMVNMAIRHYQKVSYKREVIGVEDHQNAPVEAEVLHHMSETEILKEIDKLPDGYRIVFNLYVIEEYKHFEISEMLGIGESASRSQLVKARKLLQKSLSRM